jgi:arginine N-succinyltransferase
MLVLRDVAKTDIKQLERLAASLNSVNLPNNKEVLTGLIEKSILSFSGKIESVFEREYLFVLEDLRNQTLIGTSMIIAQHGTRETRHFYF